MSREAIKLKVPLTIIVTDTCDQHCLFCSENAVYSNTPGDPRGRYINFDILGQELDGVYGDSILFSGGEPTLHPDFSPDGSYLDTLDRFVGNYDDPVVCTNGKWVRIPKGEPDYDNNPDFRESVDAARAVIEPLVARYRKDGQKGVRTSLHASSGLAYSDIERDTLNKILKEGCISKRDLENMLRETDLYKISDDKHPVVRVMKESNLYRRIGVLKELDKQLRQEYDIDPEKDKAILYFCLPVIATSDQATKANQDTAMDIFGLSEKHVLRGRIGAVGRARNWTYAEEPEPLLNPIIRPGPDGELVVYGDKNISRNDKVTDFKDGTLVEKPGDLRRILNRNEFVYS